jgi:hypothetical protein
MVDCGLIASDRGVVGDWRRMIRSAAKASVVAIAMVATGVLARAETIDRVLAVAAGQVIMLSDVTAARDLGLQRSDGAADPVRAILSRLIDRALMLVEVERYGPPEPSAAAVDRAVAEVRVRFATPAAYSDALARSGIDEPHLREILRQDLRIRSYLEQRFSSSDPRRQALLEEWIASLRRRGDVIDLYSQE